MTFVVKLVGCSRTLRSYEWSVMWHELHEGIEGYSIIRVCAHPVGALPATILGSPSPCAVLTLRGQVRILPSAAAPHFLMVRAETHGRGEDGAGLVVGAEARPRRTAAAPHARVHLS